MRIYIKTHSNDGYQWNENHYEWNCCLDSHCPTNLPAAHLRGEHLSLVAVLPQVVHNVHSGENDNGVVDDDQADQIAYHKSG